jgi:hypothetical protein
MGPLVDGPSGAVGPQLGEFERAQVLSGAERDGPRRRIAALSGRLVHRVVCFSAEAEDKAQDARPQDQILSV